MLQVSGITQQQFGKFKYLGGIQEWRNAEQGDCPNPQLCHLHHCLSQFFNPPPGHTRSWGRCRAVIPLSHCPELSGCAVHEEVVGWTLDNMVDGSFFCATLTGCREDHIPFVQSGAEVSDTGVEALLCHESWVMTETVLVPAQAAKMGFLQRVHSMTLYEKVCSWVISCEITQTFSTF